MNKFRFVKEFSFCTILSSSFCSCNHWMKKTFKFVLHSHRMAMAKAGRSESWRISFLFIVQFHFLGNRIVLSVEEYWFRKSTATRQTFQWEKIYYKWVFSKYFAWISLSNNTQRIWFENTRRKKFNTADRI